MPLGGRRLHVEPCEREFDALLAVHLPTPNYRASNDRNRYVQDTTAASAVWIELPAGFDSTAHVALSVAGDSMAPVLNAADVALVNTRRPVPRSRIVVARHANGNHAAKLVTICGKRTLHLSSLDNEYASFMIGREAVVGVGVATLHEQPGSVTLPVITKVES